MRMSASPATSAEPARSSRASSVDTMGMAASRTRKQALTLGTLFVLLVGSCLAAISQGAVPIPVEHVLAIFADRAGLSPMLEIPQQHEVIVWNIRLPRVVLGALVGASLAVSGAAMQGLFRNPLAAPGLIGVSSGAALAAVITLVLGTTVLASIVGWLGTFAVPVAAFVGGVVTTVVVYRLATRNGRTSVATMLLAGIAINALAGAGTGLMIFLADDDQLRDVTFWTLGSLGRATWTNLAGAAPFMLLALCIAPFLMSSLNAMLLGEAEARHLGVAVERVKQAVIGLAALGVGAAVAVTGVIGFVGLVGPHLLRLAVGPDHRLIISGAALLGGALLVKPICSPASLLPLQSCPWALSLPS